MAQLSMISAQVEIKSHADVFYRFLKTKVPQFSQFYPECIKSIKLLEGNKIRDGVVVSFVHVFRGRTLTKKDKIELDEPNKSINFVLMEGDVLELLKYNSMKSKLQVNSGHVKVTIEFEKASEDSPNPDGYISNIMELMKRLDACLCSA